MIGSLGNMVLRLSPIWRKPRDQSNLLSPISGEAFACSVFFNRHFGDISETLDFFDIFIKVIYNLTAGLDWTVLALSAMSSGLHQCIGPANKMLTVVSTAGSPGKAYPASALGRPTRESRTVATSTYTDPIFVAYLALIP